MSVPFLDEHVKYHKVLTHRPLLRGFLLKMLDACILNSMLIYFWFKAPVFVSETTVPYGVVKDGGNFLLFFLMVILIAVVAGTILAYVLESLWIADFMFTLKIAIVVSLVLMGAMDTHMWIADMYEQLFLL